MMRIQSISKYALFLLNIALLSTSRVLNVPCDNKSLYGFYTVPASDLRAPKLELDKRIEAFVAYQNWVIINADVGY